MAAACRLHGIHRSTFYRWKAQAQRFGLEVLRPRERRRPQMPNAMPVLIEQRIVAFALGHPGYGPAHISSELRREKWGGLVVSANGVWRVLRYLDYYNYDRTHNGRLTKGRIPAEVLGAAKMYR